MIKYIYIILSKNEKRRRISFYFPWIGILLGSIFLFLIDGIMLGMESKIFSKINEYTNGYKVNNLDKNNFYDFESFLKENNISYSLESNRDVVLFYDGNYSIVNLVINQNSPSEDKLKVGRGISFQHGIEVNSRVTLFSPLDISMENLNVPKEDFVVTSIYEIPVVDFDRLYIYGNNSIFNNQLSLNSYFVIDEKMDAKKTDLLLSQFHEIELTHWANKYKELSAAIELEKYMYKFFAYLLILISCLGIFTISNHAILNKSKNFAILNVFGVNNRIIRNNMFYLMTGLTILSTLIAFISTELLVYFQLLDPILGYLFPSELFYDFNIIIDYINLLYVTLLNLVSIILSIYIPLKIIDSTATANILNKRI